MHGDWASVDEDGYWFLHGRSDDTLNIAGKRIGPAELESAVVGHPAVAEAAAVGVPHEVKGEVAWVFCALVPGVEPSDELAGELRALRAGELGKAFTPERVLFVSALPKTRSAKIVRRAVRARRSGTDPGDLSSLENPETLEEIAALCRSHLTTDGQIALVTGGGRGIGASIARELAAAGARVAVAARTREQVEAGRAGDRRARARGGRHRPGGGRADGGRGRAGARADRPARRQRRHRQRRRARLGERPDEWWQVFEVNVLGVYLCCRAVLPGMLERGRGRIVITGSGAGYLPGVDEHRLLGEQGGGNRFGETLAESLRETPVRVFLFSPGLVRPR